ncbi:MAG: hypothetical protein QOK17_3014 [Sphingomonadales bacterium]|jgi:hypothetical protein|nr:hypothetical protein [Sphingomonadales bacterium]
MADYAMDEIPTDDEVLAAIGRNTEGQGPSEVLNILMRGGHTRANSQRAIQRVLDRGKVNYTTALRLVLADQAMAA